MSARVPRSLSVLASVILIATSTMSSVAASGLGGADDSVLKREPQLAPDALGDGSIVGLQYGDAAEGLVIVDPPAASNGGGAAVDYPLAIPKGRGIAPDLTLSYDSGGGNGWVGLGWDLSVGDISVDNRWGVPRFNGTYETETYLLDGDMLFPNAIRSDLSDPNSKRITERQDWTRRVETEYEYITRHGDSPKNYYWEVVDKLGGVRWYGGLPDNGGPFGDTGDSPETSGGIDKSAILYDDNDNAVRWMLSAQRDVGVNMIRYHYTKVAGTRPVGGIYDTGGTPPAREDIGRTIYLSSIEYTGGSDASGEPEDPAYQVRLLRDGGVTPEPATRKDVTIDARNGFLEVGSDLLRRVEVWHGDPVKDANDNRITRTTFDKLAVAYDLKYTDGAFGKSLLSEVTQRGDGASPSATHKFAYYDRVRTAAGGYDGFETSENWDTTGPTPLNETLITGTVPSSVLGSSLSDGFDVRAYIGFNPIDPSKTGSAGGAFAFSFAAVEGLIEFMDINGDTLPDKVYRGKGSDAGKIFFQLNTSGPDGGITFGPSHEVKNLHKLSTEYSVGVMGGIEAYFGVTAAFDVSGDVGIGDDYFTDVNTDGLIDFVSQDTVYFNRLVTENGVVVPSFQTDSSGTRVPVEVTPVSLPVIDDIAKVEAKRREQSPLHDTVRRWVAPLDGTITITGSPTLLTDRTPQGPGQPAAPATYKGDGVRVAIQQDNTELWHRTLATPGSTATPTDVSGLHVAPGAHIYFRVGSIDDGAGDDVSWTPHITYTAVTGASLPLELDVNGLSQSVYDGSTDFTLAGRPGSRVMVPLTGTLHVETTVKKSRATSDDAKVQILHNGTVVKETTIAAATVDTTGIKVEADVAVLAPTATKQEDIRVRLVIDSPVDIRAFDWHPRLWYTAAQVTTDSGTQILEPFDANGNPRFAFDVPVDGDSYPVTSLTGPSTPWTSDLGRTVTAHVELDVAAENGAGDAVFTLKSRDGLVTKESFHIAKDATSPAKKDITVTLENGKDYWFDVSVRDPDLGDKLSHPTLELQWTEGSTDKKETAPIVLHTTGRQGMFPLAYRGWGYAGYAADKTLADTKIIETAFDIDPDDFPDENTIAAPKGFDDPDYKNPAPQKASMYYPTFLSILDSSDQPATQPVWRGAKDNLAGTADLIRSTRMGVNSPSLGLSSAGGVTAVRHIGVTAPTFGLSLGAGPAGVSFAAGPSFGLLDYIDLNGDGFPDIVAPNYVKYTDPRGGFEEKGDGVTIVNRDTTFAVSAGLEGSPVGIKGNAKGNTNSTHGNSSGKGGPAAGGEYGAELGVGLTIGASFTNPNSADPDWNDELAQIPSDPSAPLSETLADMNADGLPDRVFTDATGVWVQFNLGYAFDTDKKKWSGGGFESSESYEGSLEPGLGFASPGMEFAGGVSVAESIDFQRYAWIDVDGDGILDRLHKNNAVVDGVALDQIDVAFGSGAGLILPEVKYGNVAAGEFQLIGDIPTGSQIAQDTSNSSGGGFDFTIGIGPLCIAACYIIVNPGAHFERGVSNTIVDLVDVNGDGAPDSVRSKAKDEKIGVRINKRADTNLLRSVTNPLGGSFEVGYVRDGNTVDRPASTYDLGWVRVKDGRDVRDANDVDLDGKDSLLSTFAYTGGRYDPLLREDLGYATVVESQRNDAGDSNPLNDPILRKIRRDYLNGNVFEAGLLERESLLAPDNTKIKETQTSWDLIDLSTGTAADLTPGADDPAFVRRLGMAVAPQAAKVESRWYDAAGNLGEATWSTYKYDRLGNPTEQVDVGEPEDPADDLIAKITYSNCTISASTDFLLLPRKDGLNQPVAAWTCPNADPPGPNSPLWSPTVCPTWTSIPAVFEVTDSQGNVLRHRDGAPALCDNSSVTHLEETIADPNGTPVIAATDLNYDHWGSYNRIVYPENESGNRYTVVYEWDPDRHSDIAVVTDYDLTPASADVLIACLEGFLVDVASDQPAQGDDDCDADTPDVTLNTVTTAELGLTSSADFDGLTGRISSRTDSSGNKTSYRYDKLGRIEGIIGPNEQGVRDTVTYEYHHDAAAYAYAIADHFDSKHAADPIRTVTFMDGMGRKTQVKQDGAIFTGRSTPAADRMIVSGLVAYDALGRIDTEYYPTHEALGAPGTFNPAKSSALPTKTVWNLQDLETKSTAPDASVTTTAYGFATLPAGGPKVFETLLTDANGSPQATQTDVRDNVRAVDLRPVGSPILRTAHTYDPLGQLLTTTDPNGRLTTNEYDLLGRRTSTTTPDAGKTSYGVDAFGNVATVQTPNLLALNDTTKYHFSFNGLASIEYPAATGTAGVQYEYGLPGGAANAVGRIVHVEDGARSTDLAYDKLGNVVTETSIFKDHNYQSAPITYTTGFSYDSFGRLLTTTYPDGEVVTNGYDSGGLLNSVQGVQDGRAQNYVDRMEYDEFQAKRYQKFGNGVESEVEADPATRRVAKMTTDTPTRNVQRQSYTYDLVGNVLTAKNDVPPAQASLYGGTSNQIYGYDAYYRLKHGEGTADTKLGARTYSLDLTYDADGNVRTKTQSDKLKGKSQTATTYTYNPISYVAGHPHQIAKIGTDTYSYDADGNFSRIVDAKGKLVRQVSWDAADRMIQVNDGANTTDFRYDDLGRLAIERGPQGETVFVNKWFTVPNGAPPYKHIWADNERVAVHKVESTVQLDGSITFNDLRYYLTKDLQGSTRIVTDNAGLVFERREFLASGETWMREDSTIFRTPFLYADSYFDEIRGLHNFDQRWYEPKTQMFYSPDPVLAGDPNAAVDDPALLTSYTYAEHNPLRLVDPTGEKSKNAQPGAKLALARVRATLSGFTKADFKSDPKLADIASRAADGSRLWKSLVKFSLTFKKSEKLQAFSEKFDANPLVEFSFDLAGEKLTLNNFDKSKFGGVAFGFLGAQSRSFGGEPAAKTGTGTPGGQNPNANAAGGSGSVSKTSSGQAGGNGQGTSPAAPASPATGGGTGKSSTNTAASTTTSTSTATGGAAPKTKSQWTPGSKPGTKGGSN